MTDSSGDNNNFIGGVYQITVQTFYRISVIFRMGLIFTEFATSSKSLNAHKENWLQLICIDSYSNSEIC